MWAVDQKPEYHLEWPNADIILYALAHASSTFFVYNYYVYKAKQFHEWDIVTSYLVTQI